MYAIVELMGRRRYGARVSEAELAGAKFVRAEVLSPDPATASEWGPGLLGVQLVNPTSLYAVTPCSEAEARKANRSTWQVQAALPGLPEPERPRETVDPFDPPTHRPDGDEGEDPAQDAHPDGDVPFHGDERGNGIPW
jgi:hypothetical protein